MDSQYEVYLDNTFLLVNSIVLKSEESAASVNDDIILRYGAAAVTHESPETWKYYLNLSGMYHFDDKTMEVISLDTLEPIIFNKRNMVTHTSTLAAYQVGSPLYKALVAKYPEQEILIKGISRPVDINVAISAPNDTILTYDEKLVEYQEETLMFELQKFIIRYKARWDVKDFVYSDSYYFAANYALLYIRLVPVILNLRLKNCKTREAHSYHIREYLKSHNGLDIYIQQMTLKQLLFLYRNILHLERNAGKTENFVWLIEKMLTDRYIPIHDYTERHRVKLGDELPELVFKKSSLNRILNTPEKIYFSLDEILSKELDVAVNNPVYTEIHRDKIKSAFQYSESSVVQTKMLESALLDYSEFTEYTREFVYLAHWAYLTQKGYLKYYISFKELNGTLKTLSAKDAFIYYTYLYAKEININIERMSTLLVTHVVKEVIPTEEEFNKDVSRRFTRYNIAEYMVANAVRLNTTTSAESATKLIESIYKQIQNELTLVSNFSHMDERAYCESVVYRRYQDILLDIDIPDMSKWLFDRNLSTGYDSDPEYKAILDQLFVGSTGVDVDGLNRTKALHKAMLSILKQLSSYSIQLVGYTNDVPIRDCGFRMIRPGDLLSGMSDTDRVDPFSISDDISIRMKKTYATKINTLEFMTSTKLLHLDHIEVGDDYEHNTTQANVITTPLTLVNADLISNTLDHVSIEYTTDVETVTRLHMNYAESIDIEVESIIVQNLDSTTEHSINQVETAVSTRSISGSELLLTNVDTNYGLTSDHKTDKPLVSIEINTVDYIVTDSAKQYTGIDTGYTPVTNGSYNHDLVTDETFVTSFDISKLTQSDLDNLKSL
jgi:hypothetical protein